MFEVIDISSFLNNINNFNIIDVRSPGEYNQGCIPGAYLVELFSDEVRKVIGTIYKQQGHRAAMLKALELVGPNLRSLVESLELISSNNKNKDFLIYCARGGMRSASIAWLLSFFGHKVYVLKRGYKSFKAWTREIFFKKNQVIILAGKTGSGKTQILLELRENNYQVINLEELAGHKGSVFGLLKNSQPTQEQFNNLLALQWWKVDSSNFVYIEDESRVIGKLVIPEEVWQQMRFAQVLYINMPTEHRVKKIIAEYSNLTNDQLVESILKIKKRLGGLNTQKALDAIVSGDRELCCKLLLEYYDKAYQYGLEKRDPESIEYFNLGACGVKRFGLSEHLS